LQCISTWSAHPLQLSTDVEYVPETESEPEDENIVAGNSAVVSLVNLELQGSYVQSGSPLAQWTNATMVIHVSDTEAPSAGAPAQEGGRKGMEIVWTPASESNVGDAELPHLGWSKQWARGIRLYFFDEKQLTQSPEGEFDPVIEQWLDMGAKVVREKQSCTHLVLDHMEIGDEERDIIARDDMRWAERNSIGMLSVCKKKNFACQELAWLRAQLTDGGARVCLPFCSLRFVPLAHDVCL